MSAINNTDQRLVIVGIGGCGGNMVNSFAASEEISCHTIALDTDDLGLKSSTAAEKFLLIENGASPACGLHGDIELGIKTGLHFREKFFERVAGYNTIILCAGLGGGTGSGIATVLAKTAIDMGMKVLCFLTLPFDFEGEERRRKAHAVLNQIKSYDVEVEIFDNQELFGKLPEGATFGEAFKVVNGRFLSILHEAEGRGFNRQSFDPSRCKVS